MSRYFMDNNPWITVILISELDAACLEGFPDEHAGILEELRAYILKHYF